ncbi:MAG: rod shape-determining protein MreD [Thermoanaerobaculia bacterium]
MRSLRFAMALAVATLLQVAGVSLFPQFSLAVDFFLVIVVFNAMDGNSAAGMFGGTVAGLVTDGLTGGYFGLFGIANTVVGYGTAITAQRLVIQRPASSLLVFAVAAAAQQLILLGLSLLFLADADLPQYSWILVRVGTTGVLGGVLYLANRRMRSRLEMWRRTRKTRIRFEG